MNPPIYITRRRAAVSVNGADRAVSDPHADGGHLAVLAVDHVHGESDRAGRVDRANGGSKGEPRVEERLTDGRPGREEDSAVVCAGAEIRRAGCLADAGRVVEVGVPFEAPAG